MCCLLAQFQLGFHFVVLFVTEEQTELAVGLVGPIGVLWLVGSTPVGWEAGPTKAPFFGFSTKSCPRAASFWDQSERGETINRQELAGN